MVTEYKLYNASNKILGRFCSQIAKLTIKFTKSWLKKPKVMIKIDAFIKDFNQDGDIIIRGIVIKH